MPSTRVKLAVIGGFLAGTVAVAPMLHPHQPAQQQPAAAPVCDAACHAAGLAQIQARINTEVTAVTVGRRCYPDRLTRYVVVRGAFIGTEDVRLVSFDAAWRLNHNATAADDVWVLARCN